MRNQIHLFSAIYPKYHIFQVNVNKIFYKKNEHSTPKDMPRRDQIHVLSFELVPVVTVMFVNEIDKDIPNERLWFQQAAVSHISV